MDKETHVGDKNPEEILEEGAGKENAEPYIGLFEVLKIRGIQSL